MQFIDLKSQYRNIKEDVLERIESVLDHGQYILGPEVKELESKLAQMVGVKHCLGVSNGTDALVMALMALDIKPGDEVITSAFSFFGSSEVIAHLHAKPVFVDINPDTYNIDPEQIEPLITDKTKAILAIDLYGQCADYDAINAIAERYNLAVIEDAAQSFGAKYKSRSACSLTSIACTSFFPSKPLGCYGDGGACFTNDDNLAQALKEIRGHGATKRYYHTRIGLNARLDTIQAAVLLAKLPLFDDEIAARQRIAQYYYELLEPHFKLQTIEAFNTSVFAQLTLEVENRDSLIKEMNKRDIPIAVHYPLALHQQPALQYLNQPVGSFKHSELASTKVISVPMHPYLDNDAIEMISNNLIDIAHTLKNGTVS